MTPKLAITLPNGRQVGIGVYARAWRELLKMDPAKHVAGFDHFPAHAGTVLTEMRKGLMDRISRHDRSYRRGRKWDPDWEREQRYAARLVNQPRLVIDWLPAEIKKRFTHRLRQE